MNFTRRILAGAALAAALAAWAPAQAQTAPAKVWRIGFSQIVDHPALNETRRGFVDGLKAAGYEVGKNLVIDYQNAQGDVGNARNIAEKFLADGVDLLAPCTTPVVLATIRLAQGKKTPVAFGCVTNPLEAKILTSLDKPTGTNITGFYGIPPVAASFDLFLRVKPGIKSMGTIYNSAETNSNIINRLAKAEAEKRGIKWTEVTVTSSAEVKNAADSLIGKVEAIVTGQDNTVASAYEAVVRSAQGAKMPLFAMDVLAVQRGAIIALAQNQYQNGLDWAKDVVVPILKGTDPGTIVPVAMKVFDLQVNLAAAKAANVTVPEDLVKKAAKVHGQ